MSELNHNPTIAVQRYGQSLWYDNIQRSLITSGELQTLINEYGVLGLTSNPTIFERAITTTADYDEEIARLVQQGADTKTIYEALVVADIRAAADTLEPVFEQTNGVDGYVSLEVSPLLAHDTEGTIQEARRLFQTVGRKNLMIKVPATREGLPAIQRLIAEGVNVNVTLIFSLERYEAVARAYLAGLKERLAQGKPLDVASVASFFVSRVDTLVDKKLDEKMAALPENAVEERKRLQALKGKAAIANAKLAYAIFERLFSEPEFKELAAHGARPQRLLWASTSTKNPAYKDTYYVEALIGKDTVNTVPPATLKAFRDHGVVAPTLHEGLDEAKRIMAELEAAGINLAEVMETLEADGVRLFAESFEALFKSIEQRRAAVLARGEASGVDSALGYVEELVKMRAASRIWQRDVQFWTSEPDHIKIIANRLGWLSVAETMLNKVGELVAFRDEMLARGLTDAVVLGMGGSSLAPDVLRATFGTQARGLRIHVLDTTDPTTVRLLEQQLDLSKTLFIVASKSGSTLEVNAFYKYFRAKADEQLGEAAGLHFIAITDEGTSLEQLAQDEKFLRVFINPSDIGGRYSALSYFGLVPAALQGLDVETLLRRGVQMMQWCKPDSAINPGLYLGAILGGMALNGRDKVTFILSPQIYTFGYWLEQLLAESTGKRERGIVPVESDLTYKGQPVILPEAVSALSEDRLFVHIRLADDHTHEALVHAIRQAGRPLIVLTLNDLYDLGAEFFRWEFATAVAGAVIGVDPFDEPNVTESKLNTRRLLDSYEKTGTFENEQSSRSALAQLNKFLRQAKPGDYVAVQAYLPYTEAVADLLAQIRARIRERIGVPVTVGYGPRFLHSTGQLHKGGDNNVVALQLTYDPAEETLIAGEPFSFATIIRAQALGDYESLKAHGRRVMRLHLGRDVEAGLQKVLRALEGQRSTTTTRRRRKKA
ncbi:MAG: bifunctional transaldolase/phosoglucose isomerase [Thermoflexales bacterium]|nr:bifunctional transaldolase/phosoglucose isomerase [Thermoflexales bacterium]MCS7324769.1 bifunctional transaldolase/phosoglucose isomerase [Thermoflexales bacterium]MDW8053093.1 bifunctional transaldolase/phosoglucose isomerase [Anaerolineae bacterium]MDW8291746.1 bifunctional transaldolase/phosoglucose isomerase [Anaerolineae bacterium]